ncbi:MAG: hypothetical protein ACHQIK_06005 [Candidatus Acidiferrales bacterium]
MSEWTPYRIGIPKESGPSSGDGQLLETVYHVVHLPTARRILEDGYLRGGLIYDESRLKKSRICVTWLSANTWAPGSIYGNVQFAFRWSKQIRKRRCYWVEAITRYNPHAYRILLTDRDLSESKYVREYDPAFSKGPLRERDGAWYWNNQYTSEFMVESDISLDDCRGFDFISHHSSICRVNGASCGDFNTTAQKVGGRVMAFLLGNDVHTIDAVLKRPSRLDPDRTLSNAVDVGVEGIWLALGRRKDRFGGAIASKSSRKAVLRGALALYGYGKTAAARELIALLNSPETFEKALAETVNEHFGTKGWTIPD